MSYRQAPKRRRVESTIVPAELEALLGFKSFTLVGVMTMAGTLAMAPVAVEEFEDGSILIELDVEDGVERLWIEHCMRQNYLPVAVDVEFCRWDR